MTVRGAANALLAALIAPPCACCGRVLDEPLAGAVCGACWDAVAAAVMPHSTEGLRLLAHVAAVGPYDGGLREVIHALKYDGRRSVAPPLARLMAAIACETLAGADLVVPVPLHRARQRARGFNQAEDLARGLGRPLALVAPPHPGDAIPGRAAGRRTLRQRARRLRAAPAVRPARPRRRRSCWWTTSPRPARRWRRVRGR